AGQGQELHQQPVHQIAQRFKGNAQADGFQGFWGRGAGHGLLREESFMQLWPIRTLADSDGQG
ncbi:hypothetical protein, partial [Escherichia coli]|uniref:hypothetical protein n=1 Tax=Escherichia coli TaxID=562 RepID=UPI0034E49796